MAYSAADVMTLAQHICLDIDDDAYRDITTNLPMLAYLNEGQKLFAVGTHCCQSQVDIAVTGNTITYASIVSAIGASAEGILYPIKVTPQIGDNWQPLYKAPMSEAKALLATGETTPTRYSLFAEKIIFDTEPGTTLSFTATISCSFVPTDLATAAAAILTPDEWVMALVKYIIFLCRVQDRDAGQANGAYAEYEVIRQQAANVFVSQIEKIPGAI